MSDLISRSELIKPFEKIQSQKDVIGLYFVEIIDEIKEQLTVYNIGKVIEELEMEMKASSGYSAERVSAFNRAIEIVKQGGVSDDFCEWTQSGDMAISPHTFSKYKIKQCDGLYALSTCPYCGKKIKVVE